MDRTILITGSTDGLGRALALRLAQDGHQLILHGRDPDRLADGQGKLAQITSGFELAGRLDNVTVNRLHPSTYMPTKMVMLDLGHSVDTIEDRRPRRGLGGANGRCPVAFP